jgi:hypothetical protein
VKRNGNTKISFIKATWRAGSDRGREPRHA